MTNSKPNSVVVGNGPATPEPSAAVKPQSIREFLDSCAVKTINHRVISACEKYGISLDSPWPPTYSQDPQDSVPAPSGPKPPVKILQFPSPFGEDTRAASNPLMRCAVFAPVKERQHFKHYVPVGSVNGTLIEWKGEQLNQDDHDTLLQLVKMASHQEFGADVVQSVNAVLTGLGRHTRQEQRGQLFAQISRLVCGTVRITPPNGLRYEGHLLDDAATPDDQQVLPRLRRHLAYRLNPKFAFLYDAAAYTLFDWRQRLQIKGRGSELAKWLHLWIESNAKQYPTKVGTLREKCGSATKELKKFRQLLRTALDLLKNAGIITAWQIDADDLIHIERTPSRAQVGHLAKKAAAKARKPRAKGMKKAGDYLA